MTKVTWHPKFKHSPCFRVAQIPERNERLHNLFKLDFLLIIISPVKSLNIIMMFYPLKSLMPES